MSEKAVSNPKDLFIFAARFVCQPETTDEFLQDNEIQQVIHIVVVHFLPRGKQLLRVVGQRQTCQRTEKMGEKYPPALS